MSCNCKGDRFFTRPIDERCEVRQSHCEPKHNRDCHTGDCHTGDRHTGDRHSHGCHTCGCHTCRCNAKSVIPGCCTGGVAGATLKDGLCAFVNRKVLIRIGCETLCVVIAEVCDCVLKAICPRSGKVLYFNLDRIVDVQDIYS